MFMSLFLFRKKTQNIIPERLSFTSVDQHYIEILQYSTILNNKII